MKLITEVILTPVFIQEGEFTNKDTKETIKYFSVLAVYNDTVADKVSIKPEIKDKVQLNKKTKFALEIDTDGKQKPKIIDVVGVKKDTTE